MSKESMNFDVLIVGAGPSGLSTAIKLAQLAKENNKELNICIVEKGGTGLTKRDITPDIFKKIFEKDIPGFGEMFRTLSYKKIKTSSLQSRACAGISNGKILFSLPGSPSACKDAWDQIIKYQLDSSFKPCNLVEILPKIK